MRYKIRALLKKKGKKYSLYVAITVNGGTPALISISDKMLPKFWNVKMEAVVNHPLAGELNAKLLNVKKSISDLILAHAVKKNTVTAAGIKAQYLSTGLENIFDFADSYRTEMQNKRDPATLENVRKHILRLENYHGSRNLHFEEITPDYLNRYEQHLFKAGLSQNYVQVLIRTIRRMFQAAKKKGLTEAYPFGAYEMLAYKAPDKQFPNAKELEKIKDFETTDPVLLQTKNWFLFGCYSGLRISDWHRFSADPQSFIKHNRLVLHPKKKSTGFVSMPIYPGLQDAIDAVIQTPLTIEEQTLNEKIKKISGRKFTAHSARHHFAVVQCLDKGISSETAAELMGITLDTFVKNYSVVTDEKIDAETLRAWK